MGQNQSARPKQAFSRLFSSKSSEQFVGYLEHILSLESSEVDFRYSHFPSDIRHLFKTQLDSSQLAIVFLYNTLKKIKSSSFSKAQQTQLRNIGRMISSIVPILWENSNKDMMINLFWKTQVNEAENENPVSENDPPFLLSLIRKLLQSLFLIGYTVEGKQNVKQ